MLLLTTPIHGKPCWKSLPIPFKVDGVDDLELSCLSYWNNFWENQTALLENPEILFNFINSLDKLKWIAISFEVP